ncbi:hypothetical protein [Devosia sp. A449]
MIKNTIVALVTAAALVGVAAPAFADNAFGETTPEMRDFVADSVLTELNRRGINATAVEDWSGLVRAYVILDDGSQVMQFYSPGSLQPVAL